MNEKPIVIKQKECLRCGYKWIPRKDGMPVTCPKCRSPYWNIPKSQTKITEVKDG